MEINKKPSEVSTKESPANFDEFMPWAAEKLGLPCSIRIFRKSQGSAPTPSSTQKIKKATVLKSVSKMDTIADRHKDSEFKSVFSCEIRTINITSIYDKEDFLVQILIDKPKRVYREVISLITLIVDFHRMLRRITINRGVDQYVIYELGKLLHGSYITEVYLDGTFVKQANYAILLTEANNLQVLSLARCNLRDRGVQDIAEKLQYPLPASHKLSMLNLSTNILTNKSAKYLATALRTNRKLCYLNLAGNKISDEGGIAILDTLKPFPLTTEETIDFKRRYVDYLKKKENLIKANIESLKLQHAIPDKKTLRRDKKALGAKRNKEDDDKIIEAFLYEKAENLALKTLGDFSDPLSDCTIINEWKYANGNSSLVYLNLAYNNLTYYFLKMLVNVIQYQHTNKIKGLKNLQLDGNPLPSFCMELTLLDGFLDMGLTFATHKGFIYQKSKNAVKTKK